LEFGLESLRYSNAHAGRLGREFSPFVACLKIFPPL
jgi:hypothetical protein